MSMDWNARQNPDGGWAYSKGISWVEPTALILLAQSATESNPSNPRGLDFLKSLQRSDGGWSPQAAVTESTWITSLAALLPEQWLGAARVEKARGWLVGQTGRESGWRWKLTQRMNGNKEDFPDGWPWFPGAAAWVIPTSFGILAFEKALRRGDNSKFRERVDAGRRFLLSHMCADGGWNHGGNKALGRDGDSYPETTGIALLALHLAPKSAQLEKAKQTARRHLAACRTAEGTSWLRIGLAAHGETVALPVEPVCRTTMDYALVALARAERNPLCS